MRTYAVTINGEFVDLAKLHAVLVAVSEWISESVIRKSGELDQTVPWSD